MVMDNQISFADTVMEILFENEQDCYIRRRGESCFKHMWFAKGGYSTTILNIVQNTEIVFE